MIVSLGICPHSPTLIPYIGKENLNSARSTIASLEIFSEEIRVSQISTLVLLYTPKRDEQISKKIKINIVDSAEVNLEEFGDLEHKFSFSGDIGLGHRIKEMVETKMPVVDLVSNRVEDYSLALMVYFLNKMQKNGIKILPVSIGHGFQKEFLIMFGEYVKEKMASLNERYGVVAVGDLSHKLSEDSPGGFAKAGVLFDNQFVRGIRNEELNESLSIDPKIINEAEQCIFDPFCVLSGIVQDMEYDAKVLSYEHPFGVGFLVAQFSIS